MRILMMLISATTLAPSMLISTGGFSPAAARMTLNQCISNRGACNQRCSQAFMERVIGLDTLQVCYSNCDDNHAACVDIAMNLQRSIYGGASTKPPKGSLTNVVKPTGALLEGGLLEPGSGFGAQGPASTGRPIAAPSVRSSR